VTSPQHKFHGSTISPVVCKTAFPFCQTYDLRFFYLRVQFGHIRRLNEKLVHLDAYKRPFISSAVPRTFPAVASAACSTVAGRLPLLRASSRPELAARSPASQWLRPYSAKHTMKFVVEEIHCYTWRKYHVIESDDTNGRKLVMGC
jgi:hypothetical protein